jgi:tetratricopeptide (TPR) repeat protein
MRNLYENPIKLLHKGFYEEAMLLVNNQVSVYQSIYGDENIFVALGLSLLSSAYCGISDQDKAVLCANGALNAGRVYHCALIPAYTTLIQTALPNEINDYLNKARSVVSFQLGDNHWFIADLLVTAAKTYQSYEKNDIALSSITEASELVASLLGSSHPKTARCILTQGKILRCVHQYGQAESLIQQAIYSMKAAFGDSSVQYAECLYEFADVLIDEGKNDEAITYAQQAFDIRCLVYERFHPIYFFFMLQNNLLDPI